MKKLGVLLIPALLLLFFITGCGADAPDEAVEEAPATQVAVAEATAEEVAPTATNTVPPPTETSENLPVKSLQ